MKKTIISIKQADAKQKKIIALMIIVTLLCAAVLTGANILPAKVKKCAKVFLNEYYDISAYDIFSYNKNGTMSDLAVLTGMTDDSAVNGVIVEGQLSLFNALNDESGRTIRLTGVSLRKTLDQRDDYSIGYDFSAEITVYDALNKPISTREQKGYVCFSTRGNDIRIVELRITDLPELLGLVSEK